MDLKYLSLVALLEERTGSNVLLNIQSDNCLYKDIFFNILIKVRFFVE